MLISVMMSVTMETSVLISVMMSITMATSVLISVMMGVTMATSVLISVMIKWRLVLYTRTLWKTGILSRVFEELTSVSEHCSGRHNS